MVFLPGDHVLDRNITVANVSGLTMHGESSSGNRATVVCTGSFHLIFINMVDLKIDFLAFTSFTSYGLHLYSLQYTELVNCSFHDNDGTALVVESANITLAGNSEFKRNHGLCGDSLPGGAIYAVGSNLTFTGNATFLDNSAGIVGNFLCNSGGAIYTQNTVISFSGTSNFINNSVLPGYSLGGAIYTSGELSFSGTTNFINNSAGESGGAVYTSTILEVKYFPLMEPPTLSTTQQFVIVKVVVEQSTHQVCLASVEPATSSTTQLVMMVVVVVQSMHIESMLSHSVEPPTLSTTICSVDVIVKMLVVQVYTLQGCSQDLASVGTSNFINNCGTH